MSFYSKLVLIFCLVGSFLFAYPILGQDIQQFKENLLVRDISDSIKVSAYKQLWRHYINSDVDSAQFFADEGLRFSQEIKYARGIADLSVYSAFIHLNRGRPDLGLKLLKENLKYVKTNTSFLNGELFMVEWIANISRQSNQLDSAAHYLQILIGLTQDDPQKSIPVHSGLGQLYQQQQYYTSAIHHFQIADSLCREYDVDNNVCTGCISNIGVMMTEIQDYETSQKYFERARLEYSSRKEDYLLNELKLFECDLRIGQNELDQALALAEETINYFAKDSTINMWIKALNRAYSVTTLRRDFDKGLSISQQLLDLNNLLQDSSRLADAHSKHSFVLSQTGQYQEALDHLNIASLLSSTVDDLNIRMNITKNYVTLYYLTGDYEAAFQSQTEWASILSEWNQRNSSRSIKEMEIAYDIQNKEQEIALLTTQNQLIAQRQSNQKNMMIGGIGLFLLISTLLYFLYRNKRKVNDKLRVIDQIKSKLFANISHELQTPLTLIQGPVRSILKAPSLDKEVVEQLQLVDRNAGRLKRLVNNVNNLSKVEAGEMNLRIQPGFLGHHIRQITSSFKYLAESKSIKFVEDTNIPGKAYYYDPEFLETIMYNLLSNAFKYTEQGSISILAGLNNGRLEIKVIDTGIGVNEQERLQIFNRYQRGSKNKSLIHGIGLGLSLSNELAKRHHGRIELLATTIKGSTFFFTIPVNKTFFAHKGYAIGKQLIPKTKIQPAVPLHKFSPPIDIHPDEPLILLVEDNPDMQHYIHKVFENDYRIIVAENGKKGLSLASQYIPDLIISDLMMPIMDGNGMLNKIREDEKTSHIPFIMLTANHQEEAKLKSLEYGADDYMTKPFSEEELMLKVRNQISIRAQLVEKYKSQHNIIPDTSSSQLTADQEFWNRLEKVVKSNLGNVQFTAEDFAKSMLMSRMQLHRKLKALTNMSASAFMRTQRLKEAANLMKGTSMSVSEVAYAVGFSSPFYFSKCFKEMYNQVPKKYAG